MSNRSEQWDEFCKKGNKLGVELDKLEDVLLFAGFPDSTVSLSMGAESKFINMVLPAEKMEQLKKIITDALSEIKQVKETEWDKLMGIQKPVPVIPTLAKGTVLVGHIGKPVPKLLTPDAPEVVIPEKRKAATMNPVFEAAVHDMVESVKKKPDQVEEKLTGILRTEAKRIEDKPVETDPSLNKYPAKKEKKTKAPEIMTEVDIRRMYIIEGKDRKEIADFYGVSESKINNYLYLHDIKRGNKSKPSKKPAETECP